MSEEPEVPVSMTQLAYLIGRLDGKIDGLITTVTAHMAADDAVETRVGNLEKGRSWLLGASAAVSSIVALVAGIAGWHFRGIN